MVFIDERPPPGRTESDRLALLALAASGGDDGAFAELYDQLSQRVFNLVLRSVRDRPTAEDLCQEIWLRAHGEILSLKAPQAVRSWLYRIASHACIDYTRSSRGRHRNDEDEIHDDVVAAGLQPEDAVIVGSEVRFVWETLGAMAPRQSIALYLKQVDGLSYAEIASVLDCTPETVESLLFRARNSFTRAYRRMESSPAERCEMFSQVMASVVDKEPTELQHSALEAHSESCSSCRAQLKYVRKANRAYLSLPLLPIGKGVALDAIIAGGGAATGTGLVSTVAGLLGAGAIQAKLVVAAAVLVAASAIATGHDSVPALPHVPWPRAAEQARVTGTAGAPSTPDDAPGSQGADVLSRAVADELEAPAGAMEASGAGGPGPTATNTAIAQAAAGKEDPTPATDEAAPTDEMTPTQAAARAQASPDSTDTAALPADEPAPEDPDAEGTQPPPPDPTQDLPATESQAGEGEPAETGQSTTLLEDPITALVETTEDVVTFAGETVEDLAAVAGDTVDQLVEPVVTVVEPVDEVVEDLTGVSLGETVEDVTGILPGSDSTPVPLDEAVEDVVEPVDELLEDPVEPVEELLDDPVEPVEDLAGALLGTLQSTPPPSPEATPPPDPTVEPEDTPPPEEPCLLGLLLC